MTIVETCPQCGHDLLSVLICTNPPTPRKVCTKCGWHWDGERGDYIKIPFTPPVDDPVIDPCTPSRTYTTAIPTPCIGCSNHPSNGGNGICNCILGLQTIY